MFHFSAVLGFLRMILREKGRYAGRGSRTRDCHSSAQRAIISPCRRHFNLVVHRAGAGASAEWHPLPGLADPHCSPLPAREGSRTRWGSNTRFSTSGFLMNHFPAGPWVFHWGHFEFYGNKYFEQASWYIANVSSPVSLSPATNLSPVSWKWWYRWKSRTRLNQGMSTTPAIIYIQ